MERNEITQKLIELAGESAVFQNEPMSKHTTFRIGGPADWFVAPETLDALREILAFLRAEGIPYYVIGNGSNLLVGDAGYRGVILCLYRNFQGIEVEGCRIRVQAGTLLSQLSNTAKDHALCGLAFASGIPGTVGGAVMMNAGAYGGEMKDVVTSVTVLTKEGDVINIPGEEMEFGYRTSAALKREYIVLAAELLLQEGDKEEIMNVMQELKNKRVEKQPLEYPSAGSTFKRPAGYFAGKLIQDAGLRGFTVGGAQVSEKHCGFVINRGDATCADVKELMRQVSAKVEAEFGVTLEPEVRMIGE